MNAPPVEMNSMPVEYQKKNLKTGRWTDEEHELFMEALLIYGKDWDQIELRVKTRDAQHCRSHAQKFFWKIVKYLEGVEDIPAIQDAERYLEILQTKIVKPNKKVLKKMAAKQAKKEEQEQ